MTAVQPVADALIQVGRLGAAHGIKGWLWVTSLTDPAANLFGYRPWCLKTREGFRAVKVVEWREQPKGLVALLDCCPDRNAAELLRGTEIWVPKAALPDLEEGDYYWSDLIDLEVRTASGQLLGTVHSLMETGANDVIVVRPCAGSLDGRERLIPWLPGQVVTQVDLEARVVTVDWDTEF